MIGILSVFAQLERETIEEMFKIKNTKAYEIIVLLVESNLAK